MNGKLAELFDDGDLLSDGPNHDTETADAGSDVCGNAGSDGDVVAPVDSGEALSDAPELGEPSVGDSELGAVSAKTVYAGPIGVLIGFHPVTGAPVYSDNQ
jgi:hypothetical protein